MNYARKAYNRLFGARKLRTLSSLDAYDLWAASYPPHVHNDVMSAEQLTMQALMPPLAGQVVLDLACGTGRYGLLAQEQGASSVIAIDNSPAMLAANSLGQRVQATSEAIPLASESVDVVLCGLALGHLPRIKESLSEIGRVLKVDGVAMISDIHPFIALKGQQRTFRAPDGRAYAVEHYVHLPSHYLWSAKPGMVIDTFLEPMRENSGEPMVIVYRFIKPRK